MNDVSRKIPNKNNYWVSPFDNFLNLELEGNILKIPAFIVRRANWGKWSPFVGAI